MNKRITLAAALIASSLAFNANAGIVTNDTDLLTGVGHSQLSEWLGEDFDLTRIFAKGVDGDTAVDWHAAVDNKGATFTIMELFDNETGERRVIGGYNSNSWSSAWGYSQSNENFLFNLTDNSYYGTTGNSGNFHASFNASSYGATFGGGHDIRIKEDLTTGIAKVGVTYATEDVDSSITHQTASFSGSSESWTIGSYETFTLGEATGIFGMGATASLTEAGLPNDVPAPFALAGLSLLAFCFKRKAKIVS